MPVRPHIVFFNMGQADAIAIVAPDGDAAVIDAGLGASSAAKIAGPKCGFAAFPDDIRFRAVYDQGPSLKRRGATRYTEYLSFVGDPNDNGTEDAGEDDFIRRRATVRLNWTLGNARVRVVSVRGDTRGSQHDLDLDPSDEDIDENPGSIALLITLGEHLRQLDAIALRIMMPQGNKSKTRFSGSRDLRQYFKRKGQRRAVERVQRTVSTERFGTTRTPAFQQNGRTEPVNVNETLSVRVY